MGLWEDLFSNEQSASTEPWAPAGQRMRDSLLPYLDQLFEQGPLQAYEGDMVADLTPEQQIALGQLTGYGAPGGMGERLADTALGGITDLLDLGGTGRGALENYLSAGSSDDIYRSGPDMGLVDRLINDQVVNDQITAATRPIERQLMERALPGIAQEFGGSATNLGSSRRGVAEGIATRGAIESAQDVAARIRASALDRAMGIADNVDATNAGRAFDAEGRGINVAQLIAGYGDRGLSMLPGVGSMYTNPASVALQAGGVMQGQEQNEINADMERFNFNQMAPWQLAQMYGQPVMSMGSAFPSQTQTSTLGPGSVGLAVGSMMAGVPGGMPGFMNPMSWFGGGGGGQVSPGLRQAFFGNPSPPPGTINLWAGG